MTKIAIVEDTEEIRTSLKTIVESTGDFECISTFENAEDAIEQLPAFVPDIIIMDIGLPGINGTEAVKQLRNKLHEALIMMFTVYDDNHNVYEALKAGAHSYILKNTPPQLIINSLKELKEGGSPMSANIARKVVSFFNGNTKSGAADLLSNREMEVLDLLSKGFLYKEIAEKLHIATGTVKRHIHTIYEKLHVQNKTEAINKVFQKFD